MTTFAEMQQFVIENTKRPEMASLTNQAIKMATLRAHQVDFFSRDAADILLTYTVPTGNQLFVEIPDIYTPAPRLRTPDFIQGEDLVTFVPNENLEYVADYKEFWNNYNELKNSVFTLRGNALKIRFAGATGRCRLYYYTNPVVTEIAYSSWIADMHSEELAKWAAAIVWARSGFQEIAATMRETIVEFKSMLVESYLNKKV